MGDTRLQGLPPAVDAATRVVVLGSFPGVASLQAQQYYGHPRNHFWPIMAAVLGDDASRVQRLPYTQRIVWLNAHGVGLWDVYASCQRQGSLDSAIEQAQLNDLVQLKTWCPELAAIAHNGGESHRHRRFTASLNVPVLKLPSSSPANASWSLARKIEAWRAGLGPWIGHGKKFDSAN